MRIRKWKAGSFYVPPLSPACKLCAKGAKLVLLVTGLCPASCFYCPLSEKKKGKDVVYANEWKLDNERDLDKIIMECKLIEAEGAGLTGGDPLMVWQRARDYISMMKEEHGEKFHIHMYTSGLKNAEHIPDLVSSGLDEIRFHPMLQYWDKMEKTEVAKAIEISLRESVDVAVEIPSLPDKEEEMVALIRWCDSKGIKWINLNELEFSPTNSRALLEKGYEIKSDVSSAAKGSEGVAKRVVERVIDEVEIGIHYCSASFKDRIQLRNRIKRRARNVATDLDIITSEGLLIKGVVEPGCMETAKKLAEEFDIPQNLIRFDSDKKRIEMAAWILEEIAKDLKKKGYKCFIVEEYPTADRLEVERISLPEI
ncbi:MAG: radical SAM protein [Thermoplasmata archaeon]|nr:radical SAM protein [Thermoplasmata archaeon]